MNYIDIYKNDTTNGSGIRVVLWTSGCSHHCPECHNPQTWDETAGKLFNDTAEKELFSALAKPYIKGITFSGGDPLYINNLDEVLRLSQKIKEDLPDKDIWLYTGYTYEAIMSGTTEDMLKRQKILKNVDILVDGPFIINLKDLRLKWRGSSNQRIINVQNSLKENNIVIEEE